MTEQDVKALRVNIDELFTLLGQLNRSREVSLAITSAQLSKMWLGKVLQAWGTANPYPNSKDTSNTKIEPTADVAKDVPVIDKGMDSDTCITTLKWFRACCDVIAERLEWMKEYKDGYSEWKKDEKVILAIRLAQQYIVECGMWLGMELGRINDERNG